MTQDSSTSDHVGTQLLLETPALRVWELALDPGQSSGLHRHEHDYFFVYTTEENVLEVRVRNGPALPVRASAGYVALTQVGDAQAGRLEHELVNVGTTRHHQIVVELIGTAGQGPSVTVSNGRGEDYWVGSPR
jgi:hypothetical protein